MAKAQSPFALEPLFNHMNCKLWQTAWMTTLENNRLFLYADMPHVFLPPIKGSDSVAHQCREMPAWTRAFNHMDALRRPRPGHSLLFSVHKLSMLKTNNSFTSNLQSPLALFTNRLRNRPKQTITAIFLFPQMTSERKCFTLRKCASQEFVFKGSAMYLTL